MKQTKKTKLKGISLIVLVITIIVMIILATAVIIALNNSGIIQKATEAARRTTLKNYQYELELYLGDRLAEDPSYNAAGLTDMN